MIWLVMQRSVWNDIVSWQTRRLNNSTKYLLHASMTTTLNSVGELSSTCSQIVLKCLYLARIGRPDYSMVSKLSSHDPSQDGPRPVTNA